MLILLILLLLVILFLVYFLIELNQTKTVDVKPNTYIVKPNTYIVKSKRHHLIGGCSGTRYGCCPDGYTAKNNHRGSNC